MAKAAFENLYNPMKAIAGFIALDGPEAIVFTGGIGEHDAATRGEIAGNLRGLGVELDVKVDESLPILDRLYGVNLRIANAGLDLPVNR